MNPTDELRRESGGRMSITDELRVFAKRWPCTDYIHNDMLAIADRIDAEHKKACDDAWDNGYEADYLGIEKWLTEHPQVMEHHGWVRLPKDADGEYIHIGDVMVYADGNTYPMEVVALVPPSVFLTDDGPRYADMCRHKPTTVEDVLREMLDAWGELPSNATNEAIVAEYAQRLQLREMDE